MYLQPKKKRNNTFKALERWTTVTAHIEEHDNLSKINKVRPHKHKAIVSPNIRTLWSWIQLQWFIKHAYIAQNHVRNKLLLSLLTPNKLKRNQIASCPFTFNPKLYKHVRNTKQRDSTPNRATRRMSRATNGGCPTPRGMFLFSKCQANRFRHFANRKQIPLGRKK